MTITLSELSATCEALAQKAKDLQLQIKRLRALIKEQSNPEPTQAPVPGWLVDFLANPPSHLPDLVTNKMILQYGPKNLSANALGRLLTEAQVPRLPYLIVKQRLYIIRHTQFWKRKSPSEITAYLRSPG